MERGWGKERKKEGRDSMRKQGKDEKKRENMRK